MTKIMLRIKNFHVKQFLGILCEIQIKPYVDAMSVCPYACDLLSADKLLIKSSWNMIQEFLSYAAGLGFVRIGGKIQTLLKGFKGPPLPN